MEETKQSNLPVQKKFNKVVTSEVTVKKKEESQFAKDMNKAKDYVIFSILLPAGKKLLDDIITSVKDILIYGSNGRAPERASYASRYSYSSRQYDSPYRRYEPRSSLYSQPYAHDNIVFATINDAEKVLNDMNAAIYEYGKVRVGDYYDMAGEGGSFTDYSYGWRNLSGVSPVPCRGGYILNLPKPVSIMD